MSSINIKSKKSKLTIWDSDFDYENCNENEMTLMWRHYENKKNPLIFSIPRFIELNDKILREKYLAYVYDLGNTKVKGKKLLDLLNIRSNFSYWWMTLIAEKCNSEKSPLITDIIKVFALELFLEKSSSIKDIKLISSNKILVESLSLFCKKKSINFKWNKIKQASGINRFQNFIQYFLPYNVKAIISLTRYIYKNWSLRGNSIKEWKKSKGEITFISYFLNFDLNNSNKINFQSRYWTNLVNYLDKKRIKTNWIHIYSYIDANQNSKSVCNLINKFNNSSDGLQKHVTLSSFLTFKIIYSSLIDWIQLRKKSRYLENDIKKSSLNYVWPLIKKDWRDSIFGSVALINMLDLRLFESSLGMLPKQKKGIYLQENQGWESGFINSWRNEKHGTLIGFPHATVCYWDLRYFFDKRIHTVGNNKINFPIPDFIACNGNNTLNAYLKSGFPKKKLIKVESLRFLYLNKTSKTKSSKNKNFLRLLVVGDHLKINTHKQLNLLNDAIVLFKNNIKISFKPHPATPINTNLYSNLSLKIETQPLQNILANYDIAYTSITTSAAVDAYCFGIPVITYRDGADLNLSQLRNCRGVKFVSNHTTLANLLNNPKKNQNNEDKEKYFYLNDNLKKWQELFK